MKIVQKPSGGKQQLNPHLLLLLPLPVWFRHQTHVWSVLAVQFQVLWSAVWKCPVMPAFIRVAFGNAFLVITLSNTFAFAKDFFFSADVLRYHSNSWFASAKNNEQRAILHRLPASARETDRQTDRQRTFCRLPLIGFAVNQEFWHVFRLSVSWHSDTERGEKEAPR